MTRKQTPSNPDSWLYRDYYDEEGNFIRRAFSTLAYLCDNDELLPECTNQEKLAWEAAHPEPEPEEPKPEL